MINKKKSIVIDIDGTLCPIKKKTENYEDLIPFKSVVKKIEEYRAEGFYIILFTARNMRTYDGNLGLINANTSKKIILWLEKHKIIYDEIYFGKPWPGEGGFYVDDRTIRPSEFIKLSYKEINKLLDKG
tara:strand:- start:153 stop:539 length:387 start_codon:yes stop_codon:yes gene_type:complete